MAAKVNGEVKHLVVDAAGFIKHVELQSIGKRIYTLQEVVQEIKDPTTRQRLAVLPYEVTFKQPSTVAIKAVTDFSKLTGDFKVLSAVDLRVLALTYQLEKECCGIEHLKTRPINQVQISKAHNMHKIPGFYVDKPDSSTSSANEKDEEMQDPHGSGEDSNTDEDPVGDDSGKTLEEEIDEISTLPGCSISGQSHIMVSHGSVPGHLTAVLLYAGQCYSYLQVFSLIVCFITAMYNSSSIDEPTAAQPQPVGGAEQMDIQEINNRPEDHADDEGFVEEDEEGWITPENIQAIKNEMGETGIDAIPADVEVGCLTTDFAMQNVLIQMGLHVVSVDGMLIHEARSYVLKCYACFSCNIQPITARKIIAQPIRMLGYGTVTTRVCHQMDKRFCPWCGNKTMTRICITVDENGVTRYNIPNRKRPFNIRGKKFPLPLPQGGRCGDNPVLVEDQPRGQRRLPPKRDKVEVLDPDFVARSSPFMSHDVNSRAVHHGFHVQGKYWDKRNPNEAKKTRGRRKKK
ncbi:hypothetical protein QZH41_010738 [Actinostola sp. cb2023]|nr:hypothetical protein QZH41_010738 [Actinostola sp. cb2023]